jgi:hypothetical protein
MISSWKVTMPSSFLKSMLLRVRELMRRQAMPTGQCSERLSKEVQAERRPWRESSEVTTLDRVSLLR